MARAAVDGSTPLPPPPLLPPQMTKAPLGAPAPVDFGALLRSLTVDNPMFAFQNRPDAPAPELAQGISQLPVLGGLLNMGSHQIEQGALGGPQYQTNEALGGKGLAGLRNPNPDVAAFTNTGLGVVAGGLSIEGQAGKAALAGRLSRGAQGADQSAIAAKMAAAGKSLTKNPARAVADELAAPTRYTVVPGKTVSRVIDTKTGQQLPTIFAGPKHLENAGAEVARRNALEATSQSAKTVAAAVASETNPLRKLSTAQLGALHGVTQNPADKQVIEALLGERAFSIAPEDKIASAIQLIDRDVAANVRRAIRGEPDAVLTKVEDAVDAALAEAKLDKSPANRTAVLQGLMDREAKNNIRNAEVNAARGGGKKPPQPPPSDVPPPPPEVRGTGRQIYESIRELKSFIDLPLGRQGIRAIGSPIAFAKGAVASIKAYKRGPKLVTEWLDAKKADPTFKLSVEKGGVEYTSSEAGSVVGKVGREEAYPGGAVEQVPVLGGAIQHSNAAYTHSLNVIRYEKFKGDMQQAEWLWKHLFRQKGPLPDSEIAGIGRNVNVSTGRGQLGFAKPMGNALGSVFFSPRNTVSWPQFFTDWALHIKDGNKAAAALQAKTLVTFLGFGIAALKAHEAITGQPVETDPRSSDFLKVVDGDQRLDIFGGGQQWMTALARLSGKSKSLAGNLSDTTIEDVLGSFVLNRTHPGFGTAIDVARLGLTTAGRAVEGKPFTGTAKDAQGVEYGVLETILGATAPIVASGFLDSIRFEMAHDKNYIDAALHLIPQLAGFGGGEYRAGYKQPPFFAPETPPSPGQILLSGQLQKQQNEQVAAAKKQALGQLTASEQFKALPPESQKKLSDKLAESVGQAANKAFGLNLALNGNPDESKQGAVIAFNADTKSYGRGQLLTILQTAGKLTPEARQAIEAKRDQTDPAKPNYDMSVDDYIHGAQLVNQHAAAPEFIFGTPQEWASAARAAELLRKMIADDVRVGKKPSEDQHIQEFYDASPGLQTFYEKDGSRRPKLVSPQRKAIEQDLLWNRFADAAREKEAFK